MRKLQGWVVLSVVALGLAGGDAHAMETRFGVDARVDVEALARTGKVEVHDGREGRFYSADASAVLRVDLDRLEEVSLQYDRYVEFGMPGLRRSHIVRSEGGMRHIWTEMESYGIVSRHYLHAEAGLRLPEEARGIQWELLRPGKGAGYPFPDQPAFARLDGSWYLRPIGQGRVYVRYFLLGDPTVSLPDFLLEGMIRRQFREGVVGVIRALARAAALR
jgi:hypothetical protein